MAAAAGVLLLQSNKKVIIPKTADKTIIFPLASDRYDSSGYYPHFTDRRASAHDIQLVLKEIYSIRFSSEPNPQTRDRDAWTFRGRVSLGAFFLIIVLFLIFRDIIRKSYPQSENIFTGIAISLLFFYVFCVYKADEVTEKIVQEVVDKHNKNFSPKGLRWQVTHEKWVELYKFYKYRNNGQLREIPLVNMESNRAIDEESQIQENYLKGQRNNNANRYIPPGQF